MELKASKINNEMQNKCSKITLHKLILLQASSHLNKDNSCSKIRGTAEISYSQDEQEWHLCTCTKQNEYVYRSMLINYTKTKESTIYRFQQQKAHQRETREVKPNKTLSCWNSEAQVFQQGSDCKNSNCRRCCTAGTGWEETLKCHFAGLMKVENSRSRKKQGP